MLASCQRLGFTPSRAARSNRRELAVPVACQVRAGNRTFEDVPALKEELRSLLHRYPGGTIFKPHEGELLLDVLKMHPRWMQKVGVGVQHFTTDFTSYLPRTRFFVVVRVDDSREDFSYLKCLQVFDENRGRPARKQPAPRTDADSTGHPPRYFEKEINAALMRAVRGQLLQFKTQRLRGPGGARCPVYPRLALNEDNCRTMYEPPVTFQDLKQSWMAQEGLSSEDLTLTAGDKQQPQQLANRKLLDSWQAFHLQHARYCLMSWVAVNSAAVLQRAGAGRQGGGGSGSDGEAGGRR